MGRYILIEFDDDATADALCARINAATEHGKGYRLRGIFQKPPVKRCECPVVKTSRTSTHRRHKKTGFTFCTKCRRVIPGWQSPRNWMDDPDLPTDFWRRGLSKEATIHLGSSGEPVKNFPITDRLDRS